MKKSIAIIGGGPAGLMAAEVLSEHNLQVNVYDSMPSFGRKFLMAGKSGLNITHSESYEKFVTRYGERQKEIKSHLKNFTAEDVRAWAKELGVETFVGTSGRVFPKEMKASPLLRMWLKRLQENGVKFFTRHHWKGWENDYLIFDSPNGEIKIKPDATVLALGGASWSKLGSSGEWSSWLSEAGVKVEAFRPSNCGFVVDWSNHFREKFHGHPIKSVTLSFEDFKQQGEFIVTKTGVEGSLIYAASSKLRDSIQSTGSAALQLDLAPDSSREKLIHALAKPRGSRSMTSHIEKTIGLKGVKVGLLYEFVSKEDFANIEKLVDAIKNLQIPLIATSLIDKAISTAGGINFDELDSNLMLKKIPGVFCAGEMLDWEAPTGGYLLTACFATGRSAGRGTLNFIKHKGHEGL